MTHQHTSHPPLALDPAADIPGVPEGLMAAAVDFLADFRPAPQIATESVIRLAVAFGYDAAIAASLCLRLFAAGRLMAGPHWDAVRSLRARLSPEERVPFARAVQQFIATAPLDAQDDFDGSDLVCALLAMTAVHGRG